MQEAHMGYDAGNEWWFRVFISFTPDGNFQGSGTDDVGDFHFKKGKISGKYLITD